MHSLYIFQLLLLKYAGALLLRGLAEGNAPGVTCHNSFDAPYGTNCPKTLWVDAMVKADPAPGKIIMDIGCNKGQSAVKWMQRWDMQGFWNAKSWMQQLEQRHAATFNCPESPDIRALATQFFKPEASKQQVEVPTGICVEPMKANIDLLRGVGKALGYDSAKGKGSFHIVHAACMDKAKSNQTIPFPNGAPGQEDLGVQNNKGVVATVDVPLKTADGLVAELGLPRVDVLLVDTEGADPAVLRGATETLKHVRYLEFEVHRDLWQTEWVVSLDSVVTDLDQKGFACYWAGNNGQLLSMNECWRSPAFERRTWANAACVKRGDVWDKVLQGFAGR